jgi:hypothetical protein
MSPTEVRSKNLRTGTRYRRSHPSNDLKMAKDPLIRKGQIIEASLVILVLLTGLLIRMQYLDERPFWVDEAESSINALTILENGYPTDAYLGIPIYENTLIQPWPGNAEYEFRDLSYSDKHLAVYHGWLPLYAIAGSFALHGVDPDSANRVPSVKHDLNEWKRRTRAARLPAVLFGVLFLAVVFAGGRIFYGPDAAWAGLLVGSVYPYHIAISRQARYYSAEVALTTACAVSLWLLVKDCKWKHVYLTAAAFVLLFHTHLLSFSAASLVCLLVAPVIVRRNAAVDHRNRVLPAAGSHPACMGAVESPRRPLALSAGSSIVGGGRYHNLLTDCLGGYDQAASFTTSRSARTKARSRAFISWCLGGLWIRNIRRIRAGSQFRRRPAKPELLGAAVSARVRERGGHYACHYTAVFGSVRSLAPIDCFYRNGPQAEFP